LEKDLSLIGLPSQAKASYLQSARLLSAMCNDVLLKVSQVTQYSAVLMLIKGSAQPTRTVERVVDLFGLLQVITMSSNKSEPERFGWHISKHWFLNGAEHVPVRRFLSIYRMSLAVLSGNALN
jgi:hypothetical protein